MRGAPPTSVPEIEWRDDRTVTTLTRYGELAVWVSCRTRPRSSAIRRAFTYETGSSVDGREQALQDGEGEDAHVLAGEGALALDGRARRAARPRARR